jgi:hypothetical protein
MNINHITEIRTTLDALSDPAIRHALISFDVFSAIFETNHNILATKNGARLPNVHRGLKEYSTAVSSLASSLGGETSVHVTLLCCQLFISIELALGDFASATEHFIRGLRIMHQYRARPDVDDLGKISMCSNLNLPHLDYFVIKLFVFDPPNSEGITQSVVFGPVAAGITSQNDARSELMALSTQTLEFLNKLSILSNQSKIATIVAQKSNILTKLQSWDNTHVGTTKHFMNKTFPADVRFSVAFSPLLHRVLKAVVSLAMSSSVGDMDVLEADFREMRGIAGFLTETKKLLNGRVG